MFREYFYQFLYKLTSIEHPRSLAHMTLLDIEKQDQSSRLLPEAIAVWRGFTRVNTSLPMTVNRERRPVLH